MTVSEILDSVLLNFGEDIQQQTSDEYLRMVLTDINDVIADLAPRLNVEACFVSGREDTPGIPPQHHNLFVFYSTAQMFARESKLNEAAAWERKYIDGRVYVYPVVPFGKMVNRF